MLKNEVDEANDVTALGLRTMLRTWKVQLVKFSVNG
jgi:hypothetical protein